MITVVDQVSPWLTPRRTLASTTQPHSGAQMSMTGTGQRDEPAGDEDRLPTEPVGEHTGHEIGGRLGQTEGDDEGQCGCEGLEPEDFGRQQRYDGPFLADHAADECIDRDEQRELPEVGPQAEPDAARVLRPRSPCRLSRDRGRHAPVARGRASARDQSWAPPAKTVEVPPSRSTRLAAVIARSPAPHIMVSASVAMPAASRGRLPSSTKVAPGTCPATYSEACRTSTMGPLSSAASRTSPVRASGRPVARQAAIPPASSPTSFS